MAFTGIEWIIVIVAIVLLLFGAKKIPEFARNLGKAKAEFQRGSMMVEKEIRDAEKLDRVDREREERLRALREAKANDAEKDEADEDVDGGNEEILRSARDLGIDPKGKTDEELRILIKHKVNET
jgi:sec-independent protein translocase protein TatA